jgi:hypothetical protein
MTLEGFGLFPDDEQAHHWQYLMNHQGQRTATNLYAVGTFYVEIWFDQ